MAILETVPLALRMPSGHVHAPLRNQPRGSRALMWLLESGGWSEREAGNLVALLHGLRPSDQGWTDREIEHLRFMRAIVESGRLDG